MAPLFVGHFITFYETFKMQMDIYIRVYRIVQCMKWNAEEEIKLLD